MSRIKVIQESEATGRLKEIYDEIILKRGQLAEVHKIQSLRPESIVKHMDLYMEIMFSKSDLSRAEREMMAVVTSVSNNCQYCQIHHSEALNNYWRNENRIESFKNNFYKVNLSNKEILLCELAKYLTLTPNNENVNRTISEMKNINFSDAAILDAALVISYFNFVNRLVLSLKVEIEKKDERNYHY